MDKPRNKEMKEKFTSKGTKKKESDSLSSMFVSAESFAHMLEENADGMMNPITTQSLANKDRASKFHLYVYSEGGRPSLASLAKVLTLLKLRESHKASETLCQAN
nr:uncharacterized protein LOC123748136 [Procambarus clarkii]